MAEVFAEDAVTASAMLDDRKIEELSSGRSSIRRSSSIAPDVAASSANTSAMSPPPSNAVERTRSSTSGSMRAVSVTAVS